MSSQHFFSHVGTEPTLPDFNQYCRELIVNVFCLRTQHGATSQQFFSHFSGPLDSESDALPLCHLAPCIHI